VSTRAQRAPLERTVTAQRSRIYRVFAVRRRRSDAAMEGR